jgi:hypothetical protein
MKPEIPIFLDNLGNFCSRLEIHLIAAEISEARGGAPFVATVTHDVFLSLIELLVPKTIYYETVNFDAKIALLSKARIDYEELFDNSESKGDEEESLSDDRAPQDRRQVGLFAAERFINDKRTKQFLKRWDSKGGSAFDLHVMFFANGVFHEAKLMEQWFVDFEDERDELLERYKAIYVEANDAVEVRLDKETEKMAKQLAEHPLFTSKGATKEKREYLAQQLFPEQRYGLYSRLVSRASSILWYQSGGGL